MKVQIDFNENPQEMSFMAHPSKDDNTLRIMQQKEKVARLKQQLENLKRQKAERIGKAKINEALLYKD